MKLFFVKLVQFIIVIFILPALTHLAVWSTKEQPTSWRTANWSSAGILPKEPSNGSSDIYLMAARTGRIKGAFAVHSWLVVKKKGLNHYDRYEVVGWGMPVRKNAYDADGHWYSNKPQIKHHVSGKLADKLIPQLESAIANYRWNKRGDYKIIPGPNSNSFIATMLREIPEFGAITPTTAVGRDYPVNGKWVNYDDKNACLRVTLGGYMGITIGKMEGFEMNFLGLIAGFHPSDFTIKIPAFGSFKMSEMI